MIDVGVDWPCDVRRLTSETNLGVARSVASGVSWVLAREDRAVFLEDDCVPEPTFFRFCDEILEQYRDDPRVSQVCGTNRLIEWKEDRQSYHFAYYGSAWGWATWRRAWAWFDPLLTSWEDLALRASIEARLGDAEEYRVLHGHLLAGSARPVQDLGLPVGIRPDRARRTDRYPRGQPRDQHRLRPRGDPYRAASADRGAGAAGR